MNDDAVAPDQYTAEYYLTCAAGSEAFEETRGLFLPPPVAALLERAGVGPGTRALDIGCGRGELVLNLAKKGAVTVGLDYAPAALELAGRMLPEHPDVAGRVAHLRADAKRLPLPDASVDAAFMTDVVEHLRPWELRDALAEVFRVLRPGGRLLVHTMPNLNYYRFAWPVLRAIARVQGERAPRDPRSEYEHELHVNEQSPSALRDVLRGAGFEVTLWVNGFEKVPLRAGATRRIARGLVNRTPIRWIGAFHVYADARRPS